jgi:transposase
MIYSNYRLQEEPLTSIVIHKNKKTGGMYAYESTCSRDPVTRKPKSKQKYLGKWDPITKTIISTKGRAKKNKSQNLESSKTSATSADYQVDTNGNISENGNDVYERPDEGIVTTKIVGPRILLDLIAQELGILAILKKIFPNTYKYLLSIIFNIDQTGQPLYRIKSWSNKNDHPYQKIISAPRISEFLSEISLTEIQSFLYLWLKNLKAEEFLYYDITSISTYSKNNYFARRGYNRDHEHLDQINLSLLVGQESMVPAHFRTIRGNINDVSSLKVTFEYLNFLDIKKPTFVLDRGFYSVSNVTSLLNDRFHFIMSLPSNRTWVEKIIDQYFDLIKFPEFQFHIGEGETIFAIKHITSWLDTGRRVYLHIFYQHEHVNNDYKDFLENINTLKEEIEAGKTPSNFLTKNYIKYLLIKDTPIKGRRVDYNSENILKYKKKYCGFFCLLSPNIINPIEAIKIYRNRDNVEKYFDDLKNLIDSNRLRVHASDKLEARIFIQFLSLVFTTKLRSKLQKCDTPVKNLSLVDIFDCLEILTQTTIKGRYGKLFTEADKETKKILDFFKIAWPPS